MDADRFDTLLRSLSTSPSRRRALQLLAGLVLGGPLARGVAPTEAHNALKKCKKLNGDRKKRCLKKAKQHNATHSAPAAGICIRQCGGKVCGPDGCGGECGAPCANGCCDGGTCADFTSDEGNCGGCGIACGAGQLCAQGQCVTGQGSCAAGADRCVSTNGTACGTGCSCFITMANQTRCGESIFLGTECGQCTSDAECETLFPTVLGAFCIKDTGDECACALGQGFCHQPCRNPA